MCGVCFEALVLFLFFVNLFLKWFIFAHWINNFKFPFYLINRLKGDLFSLFSLLRTWLALFLLQMALLMSFIHEAGSYYVKSQSFSAACYNFRENSYLLVYIICRVILFEMAKRFYCGSFIFFIFNIIVVSSLNLKVVFSVNRVGLSFICSN